jgi:hypothetical protein
MKKLACFSILFSLLTSSSIAAQAPTIKLGGRIETFIGYRKLSNDYSEKIEDRIGFSFFVPNGQINNAAIVNDTKIDINIDGISDSGYKYGGLIRLHGDTSLATNEEDGNADKVMFYLQNDKIGRVEAGNYPGSAAMFEMDSSNVAKAAYGVDGYWSKWVHDVTYVNLSTFPLINPLFTVAGVTGIKRISNLMGYKFLVTPNLPSNYSGYYYSDAPKLTFYTQPIPELTVGITYIPDLDSTGSIATIAGRESGPTDPSRFAMNYRPTFRDIWSGGLQYKTDIRDFKVKASIVGEVGKAKKYFGTDIVRDLKAIEAGFTIGYEEYAIAASYGSWFNTATYRKKFDGTKQKSHYWTLGFSQTMDKFGYSITYMKSLKAGGLEAIGNQIQMILLKQANPSAVPFEDVNFSDRSYNKFTNLSLGAEYKLAPGLLPYAEASFFRMKDSIAPTNNNGAIYLTGLRLTF